MGIDHLYASTEEAKQMLRDALRDPPGGRRLFAARPKGL
jgi:hypothetical protein